MPEKFEKVRRFQELLYEEKIANEFDAVIPVIADEGFGKSTFILGFVWNWKLVRGIDPTVENVLGTIVWDDREEFKQALVEYDERGVLPVMDAVRILFAKDAMQSSQKEAEKDLLDMRVEERVILLGYQSWKDMPPVLRRRRARYAFRIPTRGEVHGYNRESLDEVHESGGESWPQPDLYDQFPSLDGTDLWEEFKRRDKEHKRERILGEDGEEDDSTDLEAVVEEVKESGIGRYVSENPTNGQKSLDKDLIRYDFGLSLNEARTVKKVLDRDADVPGEGGEEET